MAQAPGLYTPTVPVPADRRILGGRDLFTLWFSLGIGLMVAQAGALLAPGLGLADGLLVLVLGTGVGVLLLAAAGLVGSDTGLAGMSALGQSLGQRGALLPAVLNITQLIGWGAFELVVMREAASVLLGSWGLQSWASPVLWTLVFGALATALAVAGPLTFVRRFLSRWGIWLLLGACGWLTLDLFLRADLSALWQRPGDGSLTQALGFDLVVAMPLSWLPVIADYTRFARTGRSAGRGVMLGYFCGNLWLMGLGFAYTLAFASGGEADALLRALAVAGLGLPLLLILLDESENAFAAYHSAAVATGFLAQVKIWQLTLAIGILCTLLALLVPLAQYEHFLLLIGSVFAPLFGVVLVDHFLLRRRKAPQRVRALRLESLIAWALGVAVYHLLPTLLPAWGATLPAIVVAGTAQALLGLKRV